LPAIVVASLMRGIELAASGRAVAVDDEPRVALHDQMGVEML
jgi:hypothetical protein